MRIQYLGLAIAGNLALGALVAANQAAAQSEPAIGESSALNLSLEQQNMVQGWYDTLGEYKRLGLAALRRGDCPTVDDYAGGAARMVTLAKEEVGAFGSLPTLVRNQIAAEGQRVIKALSVPCDSAIDRRLREAAREAERNSEAAKEKNDDNIAYAISNFFIKLGAAPAPSSKSKPRSPRRRTGVRLRSADISRPASSFNPTTAEEFLRALFQIGGGGAHYKIDVRVWDTRREALDALRNGQPGRFQRARKYLEILAASAGRRVKRLQDGPVPGTHRFVEIPAEEQERARRRAREVLAELPEKFVPGYAFARDDGTVAADPDPFVRSQLFLDRFSAFAGDGDAD